MSNIYIQEPPTNGKILLVTTVGDIDIELWSKEAPKACRNFVQLCMDGYYNDTIFHRLVTDFIVQGGDPTGTGHGGESSYGQPFKDEFHSRLRFVRRGLVAMANSGPNDNSSQFFFTLGPTQELNNKHTIFGKVGGNTIYNMIRLSETETDSNERPIHPHKILKTKVLGNPYDDIEPRTVEMSKEDVDGKRKKSKSKATKNFSLLSFGEEAEEDELETNQVSKSMKQKSKSSHDLLDDTHLSSVPAVSPKLKGFIDDKDDEAESEEENTITDLKVMEQIKNKLKKQKDCDKAIPKQCIDEEHKPEGKMQELRKETKRLKRELSTKPNAVEEIVETTSDDKKRKRNEDSTENDAVAEFKAERMKYKQLKKTQGKPGSQREEATLAMLATFTNNISVAKELTEGDPPTGPPADTHSSGDEDVDDGNLSWLSHPLHFEDQPKKVLDANIHDTDRYEIFDPRNPLNERRREASKQSMKGRDKR